jgi:hypothetical protein
MTIRRFAGALGSLLLTFGFGAIAPATGHAQQTVALPPEHSTVTVTGCFGYVQHQGYVLTRPSMGQVSVPQETCLVSAGDPMIKMRDDLKKNGLDRTMIGRFVTVSGTMGDEYPKHPDRLRKLKVESVSIPPVTPPVVAQITREPVMPAPAPPAVAPAPAPIIEAPVATTGVMKKRHHLPKTATTLPLVGFIGFVSLLSGLTLHVFGQRRLRRG